MKEALAATHNTVLCDQRWNTQTHTMNSSISLFTQQSMAALYKHQVRNSSVLPTKSGICTVISVIQCHPTFYIILLMQEETTEQLRVSHKCFIINYLSFMYILGADNPIYKKVDSCYEKANCLKPEIASPVVLTSHQPWPIILLK